MNPTQTHVERDDPVLPRLPRQDGGWRLGSCILDRLIGTGGQSRVYAARHLERGERVAVKCLYVVGQEGNPLVLERFRREAALAMSVAHDNMVRVFEAGEQFGIHYLVMELVEGETARARVARKGRLDLLEALAIVQQTLRALKAAHAHKIIHRDVKPGNILVARNARVKLADLGLAKPLDEIVELTSKGSRLGTPRYGAPEQWEDASSVSGASDVYSLGAVLYFLLTGEDGIRGDSAVDVIRKTCKDGFPPLSVARPDLPREVHEFVAKATQLDPRRRFADAREMGRAFDKMIARLREHPGALRPRVTCGAPAAACDDRDFMPRAAALAGILLLPIAAALVVASVSFPLGAMIAALLVAVALLFFLLLRRLKKLPRR